MRPGIALLIGFLIASTAHAADDNPLGLSFIETPDLRLIYLTPSLDYLTPHAIRTFTNSVRWQKERFGWIPSQPVGVFLKDFADYGNAGASPMPRNLVRVEVEPIANAFETNPGSERMASTMNHELVHVATADVAAPEDRFWRGVFVGKVSPQAAHPESLVYSYLTVPRFNVPRWLLEGSAVFMETWMGGGLGRAQGGYDEMVWRAAVRDDAAFYTPLGLESRGVRVDFQVGANAYLYGTRFITWLAYTYSPEKVVGWLRRDAGSMRHYADAFEQTFGLPLDTAWHQWVDFEHRYQRKNLVEVRKEAITPMRRLVPQPLGSSSRTYYEAATDTLYGAFRRNGALEYVGALDLRTGNMKHLTDVRGGVLYSVTSLAFDPTARRIFYTDNNLAWRDLMALDLDSGKQTKLLAQARIGELVFDTSDRSLIGVRHEDGIASLVRVPYPYIDWQVLYRFPYGAVPTDLDISPDGQRLSGSVSEVTGDQFLRVWSLLALREGKLVQQAEFGFGQALPETFVWSPDGKYLYGSSYFTGVSNIFRCDPATGEKEAVTNAETGVFRPLPLVDGRLVVQEYTGQGFVPSVVAAPRPIADISAIKFLGAELAALHPVVQTWQVPAPDTVDEEKLITKRGPYKPLDNLTLLNAFPVLQGYKETAGIGYHANVGDTLGYANFGLTAAITPQQGGLKNDEHTHVELTGRYLGLSGSLSWNRSDFYDLFGPTIRSRKGFAAKVAYDKPLIFESPRFLDFKFSLAHYRGIDTLPSDQNVASSFTRLTEAEGGFYYTNLRRSLGAVDDEQGVSAAAIAKADFAPSGNTAQQLRGYADFGIALPWAHSSLWSRTAAGAATGDRSSSLARFYFGAFGNNYVDNGEIRRYRDYDSMPGFSIDELSGLSFVRQTFEWNLPAVIFDSVGVPDAHLNWLRPTLFATALQTDPRRSSTRRNYASLGTQTDLRFSVLHWYEMVLSAGYGVGFKGGRRAGNEWMISLKIL